ncbi:MAG: YtxH domain-containing protein [Sediminicola sp.]
MSNAGNKFLGLLAGTAIGTTLGILFAPDKGVNTRKKIAEQAENTKNSLAESAHDLKAKVASQLHAGEKTLEDRMESIVSDVSYKTEDVIQAMEEKLRDLKSKNKSFQNSSNNVGQSSAKVKV